VKDANPRGGTSQPRLSQEGSDLFHFRFTEILSDRESQLRNQSLLKRDKDSNPFVPILAARINQVHSNPIRAVRQHLPGTRPAVTLNRIDLSNFVPPPLLDALSQRNCSPETPARSPLQKITHRHGPHHHTDTPLPPPHTNARSVPPAFCHPFPKNRGRSCHAPVAFPFGVLPEP
jgi:hypothetical protein